MKKNITIFLTLLSVAAIFMLLLQERREAGAKDIRAFVVYNPSLADAATIVEAYKSILEEEGVPVRFVSPHYILSKTPEEVLKFVPAIIFIDSACRILPEEIALWSRLYSSKGGNIMFVADAGIFSMAGRYKESPLFAQVLGMDYAPYELLGEDVYFSGNLMFADRESADKFQIPAGRLTDELVITGYMYGKKNYSFARIENLYDQRHRRVYAYGVDPGGVKYPAIIEIENDKGGLLFVNIPLGYLKAHASEDLLARVVLRTFLFKQVGIPHLANTPYGRGGLVINWHINNNIEWRGIPFYIEKEILRESLNYSFSVTAGPDVDNPGDLMGFDARDRGRPALEMIKDYGIIGSNGGWTHKWFAERLAEGKLTPAEIEYYIMKNSDLLEEIVGYKIREYAAPAGVHPQPLKTHILADKGFVAYYYSGDIGSSPNRTFWQGRMVSEDIIAFPVMPWGNHASLAEFYSARASSRGVGDWLLSLADYCVNNRTLRLFYSHPYDIMLFPVFVEPMQDFIDYVEKMQEEQKIVVETMTYFAEFLLRFLKTGYSFVMQDNGLKAILNNSEGLYGICVVVPDRYLLQNQDNIHIEASNGYYYVTITEDINSKVLYFDDLGI